ncbi:hypothetical protein SLEP1_g24191 [Rubroshorea leprosula]|uniref:Uncharacterized protein n=1 Tax=Rubroshorea leprosula TaxID=152421 RepID=A0AAV5JNI4_9ROSI|nr:hypothetical protein SLEP1_g24191 [Rubroshorea leprosula]
MKRRWRTRAEPRSHCSHPLICSLLSFSFDLSPKSAMN